MLLLSIIFFIDVETLLVVTYLRMKLKEYLTQYDLTTAEAARQLKVTRQHLGLIVNCKIPAGRKLSLKLFEWSNGEIGLTEHMKDPVNQ